MSRGDRRHPHRRRHRPRSWPTVRAAVDRVDIVVNNYGVAEGSDWDHVRHGELARQLRHQRRHRGPRRRRRSCPTCAPRAGAASCSCRPSAPPDPATGSPSTTRRRARCRRWRSAWRKHLGRYRHHGELREPGHHRHRRGRRELHRTGAPRRIGDRLAERRAHDPRHADGEPVGAGWRRPTTSAASSPSS